MVFAALVTLVIGAFAGVAWVTGYTLLGLEVADELRGRTFAFVQTTVRVVLVLVLAVAPLLAAGFGRHQVTVTDELELTYNGAAITFLLAGLLAGGLGFASYRHLDDRRGVPLVDDLAAAFHNEAVGLRGGRRRHGFFIALEGGEGVGKTTQARALAGWLESLGHDVLVTHEPGGTEVGRRLRSVLLDHPGEPEPGPPADGLRRALSPRAEALLFAADRAEHVAAVIAPALALGHVVITDRYVDSSAAYQGAGRELVAGEVAKISRWATDGLVPDLTVVLDLPAAAGLARIGTPDRLESEPQAFHERVRERFLEIARRGGSRYLVLDAARPAEEIGAAVRARLGPLLPPSAAQLREAERARQADLEERARAEDVRRLEEARARADAEDAARRRAVEEEEQRHRESIELEERRQQAAVEAAEQARLAAAAAQERSAEEAALAAQRGARAEERRRVKHEQRLAREEAHIRISERRAARRPQSRPPPSDGQAAPGRSVDDTVPTVSPVPSLASRADPPTRELSLTDELFGGGWDDEEAPDDAEDAEDADDRTIRLPRTPERRGDP